MSPLAQILAVANRPAPTPPQTQIAPTNVAGIYANNDAQNMDRYKAQVAQQNAMYGGLASLGSAGISAGAKMYAGGSPFDLALAPGATGGGIGGSSYSVGYGGRNVPVY